jgi:Acetyltransferase (GNAT) domain
MYWIDPLEDLRWDGLIAGYPESSVFHTRSWLETLRRTYRYRPVALTSRPPGQELVDGIPFCQVKSWISGSRLVSLPFSDHCQPLLQNQGDLDAFKECLRRESGRSRWEYVELRLAGQANLYSQSPSPTPIDKRGRDESSSAQLNDSDSDFVKFEDYHAHKIDLRLRLETLFSNFHKSCVQKKIQRAEREGLQYEAGRSESNLRNFYRLLVLTRRRHGLPPQPMAWFRNLNDCFGESLSIHIACKDNRPIAAILTLLYKRKLVYKYGCSDAAFHSLGAMPMLFWKAIQEGKRREAEEFDLGRSSIDNLGLSAFKQHLGAACTPLTYFRLRRPGLATSTVDSHSQIANTVFTRIPSRLAQIAGSLLYRHMG